MRNYQSGVALPIVLIVLIVMMLGGMSMMRASTTGAIAVGNIAYERNLARLADAGIEAGFDWLRTTSATDKSVFDNDNPGNGYVASYNFAHTYRSPNFWTGSRTITVNGQAIEYIVKRMCRNAGGFSETSQQCIQTAATETGEVGTPGVGASLSADAEQLLGSPMLHYLVTARLVGAKGASVINQAVVMIGA